METVLSLYKRLTHIGVHDELSYLASRRVQMLNLIALSCVPLTFFFAICNIINGHYLLSSINLANSAASALVLILHQRQRYHAGRFVLLSFNFLLFATGCFLYQNGAIYYLLCVLIVALLVYDKKGAQIMAGIGVTTVILLATFLPQDLGPREALPTSRQIINTIGALVFLTFIISFFKRIQYGYQKEIEEQRDKLKKMNADMQKIFSIISHDIKSPLASLQGVIALFQEGFISPEVTEQSVKLVNRRIAQLDSTLDNLLRWSSNNLGGLQTTKTHVYLTGAVQETCYFLEGLATEKAIDFAIDIDPDTFVFADRDQLSMILRNLISNAIKFSYAGGTISIRGKRGVGKVTLQVIDRGMGMSKDNENALFRSLQKPSFGTDGERGSGVGLMLSYELIKQNAGTITVESTEGIGTTFSIVLPVGIAERKAVLTPL
ncbi:sensor histidine kinase [Sphingobacterium deserti]|uniref:histidine kinase n=1 Tax=Sphingobacterium deserti TaxID=1229276 RepID=A0A0B8T573_9SPHI|nr:HAMP domain-containing sensor histidine kinase [Sphingobacterium deserti]KGE15568.1 ATPase domain-containing protein [Sphingobacterium deserti]